MIERISRFAKSKNKAFLNLSIDEQTGEAGFVTRIEAFTDMLFRKKKIQQAKKKKTAVKIVEGPISADIIEALHNSIEQ